MDWASIFVEFLKKKKIIVRISGKREGKNSEKISEIGEFSKKWVNGLGFFSKCVSGLTNKQTKKLRTKEFEEKMTKFIVRLTRERKKGRKKLFLAEIAKNLQKVPKK